MHLSSRAVAWALCLSGLILLLAGWGDQWGVAYGQTAGPTPTTGTVVSPIRVIKTVDEPAPEPGETFIFTIEVSNNEALPQPDVVIKDTILNFLEIVSVTTTKGTVTVEGQNVTVNVGTLDPNEVVTVTIIVRVRQTATTGDTGINIAEVTVHSVPFRTTNSNPVAIAIAPASGGPGGPGGGGPPVGLPDTGSSQTSNLLLIALGSSLLLAGCGLFILGRRRASLS